MVKNLPSNARDVSPIPGWGTKIAQAVAQLASPRATSGEVTGSSTCTTTETQCSQKQMSIHTCVQTLGHEDALEREMATHSSILAWKIPRTEEPGGL